MKHNIQRIRQRNLERLITEAGSATALARIANTNSSYLSQVRNQMPTQNGTPRSVGNGLANKLEQGMGKPEGWMDESHEDTCEPPIKGLKAGSNARRPLRLWADISKQCNGVKEEEPPYSTASFPCPIPCSDDTYVLRVRGISMAPKFLDDDLIFVDPEIKPEHGKYVVARFANEQEPSLRQLIVEGDRQFLSTLNTDWPNPIIEISPDVNICGVVIFRGESL